MGVPCNIITGPLGSGKSTAILKLLRDWSDGNWAVLVNEIGDVGIDGAIARSTGGDGTMVAEIAGGCICCANGVAMQVALTRILRRRPSRLLVEPSGLGHAGELAEVLLRPPLSNAVELRAMTCLVPCDRHARLWAEAENYKAMVHASDALVLNRRDIDGAATVGAEAWARDLFPPKVVIRAERGVFPTAVLDLARDAVLDECDDDGDMPSIVGARNWTHVNGAVRTESYRDGHGLVGLRFPKGKAFDEEKLRGACDAACALGALERFKGVFFAARRGWLLVQWVRGDANANYEPIARAADARFQLIFRGREAASPTTVAALEAAFFGAVAA